MVVVVSDVLDRYLLEMLAPEDENPIGAFSADGADEPFGERVRSRRSNGGLDGTVPGSSSGKGESDLGLVSDLRRHSAVAVSSQLSTSSLV